MTNMFGWHFLGKTLRDGRVIPADGELFCNCNVIAKVNEETGRFLAWGLEYDDEIKFSKESLHEGEFRDCEGMTLDEYQDRALLTAVFPKITVAIHRIPDQDEAVLCEEASASFHLVDNLIYPAFGLVGEAGEVAEKIKKTIRDRAGTIERKDRDALIKELGDVLWYLAVLANNIDAPLSEIAMLNLKKLADRQTRAVLKGDGDER